MKKIIIPTLLLTTSSFAHAGLPVMESEKTTLNVDIQVDSAVFAQGNSWFGASEANLGEESEHFIEKGAKYGFSGEHKLENSTIYGAVSGISTITFGHDPFGGTTDNTAGQTTLEDAVIGWKNTPSDDSLSIDISAGSQSYGVGSSILIGDGGVDGAKRGGVWIGMRTAFETTGIVKLGYKNFEADAFYLEPNEIEGDESDTKLAGVDLRYNVNDDIALGLNYFQAIESDTASREEADIWNARINVGSIMGTGFSFDGEYVLQDNGDDLDADGYYGQFGYAFDSKYSPTLGYRYAYFSGDDPDTTENEDFDPFYYSSDGGWGTWFQGELIGEYLYTNTNLITHMVKAEMSPRDDMTVGLYYYHMLFDEEGASNVNVTDDHLADEVNIIVDWDFTENMYIGAVAGYAIAGDGGEEYTSGDDDWSYGMLYASFAF